MTFYNTGTPGKALEFTTTVGGVASIVGYSGPKGRFEYRCAGFGHRLGRLLELHAHDLADAVFLQVVKSDYFFPVSQGRGSWFSGVISSDGQLLAVDQ